MEGQEEGTSHEGLSYRPRGNVDDLDSEYFETASEDELNATKPDPLTRNALPNRIDAKQFTEPERKTKERVRSKMNNMDAYSRHRELINHYVLSFAGATALLKRDTSHDRTDQDVLKANHKFIWTDDASTFSWEQRLAKKYYDKLFKEYCIADLSRYKENKVAMRWRVEKEVVSGKGQFVCGNKRCEEKEGLTSWEVNFAYVERLKKENALVKLRLCPRCSKRLNHGTQRRQAKQRTKRYMVEDGEEMDQKPDVSTKGGSVVDEKATAEKTREQEEKERRKTEQQAMQAAELWAKPVELEEDKSKEDEFDEFLDDLFL